MSKLAPIILGFLLLFAAIWIQITPFRAVHQLLVRLENMSYDLQLRATMGQKVDTKSPVIIIDVDDKSLKEQGRWPWPRNKIAQLITDLEKKGVVVIALDMAFPEAEKNPVSVILQDLPQNKFMASNFIKDLQALSPNFDYDNLFAQSLRSGETILGVTFHNKANAQAGTAPNPLITLNPAIAAKTTFIVLNYFTSNIPLLEQAAKSTGFLNVFPDTDGIIRRVPLIIRSGNNLYPSLALEATRLFLLSDAKLDLVPFGNHIAPAAILLGKQVIPTDTLGQVLIPFRGPVGKIPHISATDVLNNRVNTDELANKLAFIGTSAFGLGDLEATPIQSAYPGVEIHASIATGILHNHFPYQPVWMPAAELGLTFFLGIICILLFPFLAPRGLALTGFLIPVAVILLNVQIFETTFIVISIIVPVLLILGLATVNMTYGYLFESRRRNQLRTMFGQYVPTPYIETILQHPDSLSLQGENREMTVLFSDIRNFTTIAETLSANSIKEVLNQFFTPMTRIIFEHNGTIDKYVGDMIMAFWGAPLPDSIHARHALEAALAMQASVIQLKTIFAEHNLPEIDIGIGINTGPMNVGDMGSEFRRAYTVIGDTVNLASRLEGLTKFYHVGIIVGEETQKNQPDFVFRKLDRVKVKGKKNIVNIYEPICRRDQLTPALQEEIQLSETALEHYFVQEWGPAIITLKKLVASHPENHLYETYLERVEQGTIAPT